MQYVELKPPSTHLSLPAVTREYTKLERVLEGGDVEQIAPAIRSLKVLLSSTQPQELGLLIAAEEALSRSSAFSDLREDLLLGLINRSTQLGHDDVLMSSLDRMYQLLRERGSYEAADSCCARSNLLRRAIFGESDDDGLKSPPTKADGTRPSPSSSTDIDGSIPIRLKAFQTRTFIGTLTQANLALECGHRHFREEKWRAAKGDFMTAALLIDCPEPTVNDGILIQAQAEFMLAACYLKTFEHELAIPYARHAVCIYMNNPQYRIPALYRYALETLEEALALDPENYEELQELREIIASLDE